jgi:hypothetical protein
MSSMWKIVEAVTTVLSVTSLYVGCGLWILFAYTRPIAPNQVDGRVYPLDMHGMRVYLNAREHFGLEALFMLFAVLGVATIVIDRTKRPFGKKYA